MSRADWSRQHFTDVPRISGAWGSASVQNTLTLQSRGPTGAGVHGQDPRRRESRPALQVIHRRDLTLVRCPSPFSPPCNAGSSPATFMIPSRNSSSSSTLTSPFVTAGSPLIRLRTWALRAESIPQEVRTRRTKYGKRNTSL